MRLGYHQCLTHFRWIFSSSNNGHPAKDTQEGALWKIQEPKLLERQWELNLIPHGLENFKPHASHTSAVTLDCVLGCCTMSSHCIDISEEHVAFTHNPDTVDSTFLLNGNTQALPSIPKILLSYHGKNNSCLHPLQKILTHLSMSWRRTHKNQAWKICITRHGLGLQECGQCFQVVINSNIIHRLDMLVQGRRLQHLPTLQAGWQRSYR